MESWKISGTSNSSISYELKVARYCTSRDYFEWRKSIKMIETIISDNALLNGRSGNCTANLKFSVFKDNIIRKQMHPDNFSQHPPLCSIDTGCGLKLCKLNH